MADTEDDILKEAIAGTEREIFSEAVGKDLPSTEGGPGDRSVEEMGEGLEGQLEADEPEANAKGDGEDDGKAADDDAEGDGKSSDEENRDKKTGQYTKKDATDDDKTKDVKAKSADDDTDLVEADGKPKQRVPVSELIEERKGRRAAEAKLKELETARETDRASAAEEIRRTNARIDALLNGQTQKTQTQEPADDATDELDLLTNPQAWKDKTTAELERGITQKYVAADFARTMKGPHGDKFKTAYETFTALDKGDPTIRAEATRIWNSATPADDMLAWHGRREAARIVGDDPAAYAEKIRAEERERLAKDPEFRKGVLAHLQQEARAGDGGSPRNVARMPKSLNGAAGGQSQANGAGGPLDGSERGVFQSAFEP